MKSVLAIAMMSVLLYSCANDVDNTSGTADTVLNTTEPMVMASTTTNGMNVPDPVTTTFKEAYPDVVGAQWDWEDSMYTASFSNNGLNMAVVYMPDGKRYAVVAAIALEYLPEPVRKSAKTIGDITAANKITMDNEVVRYEVLIKDEDYFYDENGAMIQEKAAIEDLQKALKG